MDQSNNKIYPMQFQYWKKGLENISTSNFITITVNDNVTYEAVFLKLFSVAISNPEFIEGGSGGSYKVDGVNVGNNWLGTIRQNSSKTLEAVPPLGYIFIGWSDGETTNPRSLSPTDHVEDLHAIYKLPMRSSTGAATANNEQRKMVISSDNTLHMVYESGNKIFYTKSLDNGSTWQPEVLLSYPGDISYSPTIDLWDNTNPVVAWVQKSIINNSDYYKISICRFNSSNGWEYEYSSHSNSSSSLSTPVIAMPFIFCKKASPDAGIYSTYFNGSSFSSGLIQVTGLPNSISEFTAISSIYTSSNIFAAYSRYGEIYFVEGIVNGSNITWTNPVNLSPGYGNSNPTIILDASNLPHIMWQ